MRKPGVAIFFIVLGSLIILSKLGIGLGWLLSLIIPLLIIFFGLSVWAKGNFLLGGMLALVGVFILIGKFSFIFVWVVAILMVLYGISVLIETYR